MSRSFHAATPPVGTTRTWLALDDSAGFYRKQFTLRGVSAHSEVWVATRHADVQRVHLDRPDFQAGDCRNGARTTITDAQVQLPDRPVRRQHLPDRVRRRSASRPTGTASDCSARRGARPAAPTTTRATGDDIVVLVDNVRDDEPLRPQQHAGVLVHRRVLLLRPERAVRPQRDDDRRLRLAPPDRRQPAGRACPRRQLRAALRRGRSSTRASSPTSTSTCSSTTRTRRRSTGSTRACRTSRSTHGLLRPGDRRSRTFGFDSHIAVLPRVGTVRRPRTRTREPAGRRTRSRSGVIRGTRVRSSATTGPRSPSWSASTSQYGERFMIARCTGTPADGFVGLQNVLGTGDASHARPRCIHAGRRWSRSTALLDRGATLRGGRRRAVTRSPPLDAAHQLGHADAYSTPGAPPNGCGLRPAARRRRATT